MRNTKRLWQINAAPTAVSVTASQLWRLVAVAAFVVATSSLLYGVISNQLNRIPVLGGDLKGTFEKTQVVGFSGRPLNPVAPDRNQLWQFNGVEWIPVYLNSSSGSNIAIQNVANDTIWLSTTPSVVHENLAITDVTLLGHNTSCLTPLLPSCYDISGQTCHIPLGSPCIPRNLVLDNLLVHNLTLFNVTTLDVPIGNQSVIYTDYAFVEEILYLDGTLTCPSGARIEQGCLNLSNYSCPGGVPLAESCIPASLVQYDQTVTHELTVNLVTCSGPPLPLSCLPTLDVMGDIAGDLSNSRVVGLQGVSLDSTTPLTNQYLIYNGSKWTPTTVSLALGGDVSGPIGSSSVVKLQNQPVSSIVPHANQLWQFNGVEWIPIYLNSSAGSNIAIQVVPNDTTYISTTPSVVHTTLAVTDATLLGTNTSCLAPLLPSCYDISGQTCGVPLGSNCIPSDLVFNNLMVHNLTLVNATTLNVPIGNQSAIYVDHLFVEQSLQLSGPLTCPAGSQIDQGCLNLSNYSCPNGIPLAESCIPASLVQYDQTITHELTVNLVTCSGPPLPLSCLPALSVAGDVTGTISATTVGALQNIPIASTAPLTNQYLIYNGTEWTPATPSFTLAGDVTGAIGATSVVKLQGQSVSNAVPTNGAVLAWDSISSSWKPQTNPVYYGPNAQTNSGTNTVTIGPSASTVGGTNAIAIGTASALNLRSIAIGYSVTATWPNSVVIGQSITSGAYSNVVVIGNTASSGGSGTVVIGVTASSGQDSVAIGNAAQSWGLRRVAIGASSLSNKDYAIAMGYNAVVQTLGTNGISIGYNSFVNAGNGVCIGFGATVSNTGASSFAGGRSASATGTNAVALGAFSVADVANGIAIGNAATTNAVADSISFGPSASPLGTANALALAINAASALPGTLGITLNGAARVLDAYSSLFASTAGVGPTVLTATSAKIQWFTTAQTVTLPVVSTLQLGFHFTIVNNSGGNLVVQSSGGNTKITLATNTWAKLVCISITGTTDTSWGALSGGAVS